MRKLLEELLLKNIEVTNHGNLANYIPALNKEENKNDLGLCIIDSKENIFPCGDFEKKFTIQSVSKVLTLMLAIKDIGLDKVFNKVGYEGTDEAFNSFTKLDSSQDSKPANPMINSGALVITSLIHGEGDEKFNRILEFIRKVTKNPELNYNEEVYISELETTDRNRSMAYLLKSKDIIEGNIEGIIDSYTKQCSIEINTIDLAHAGRYISLGCKDLLNSDKDNQKISKIIKGILLGCGMYDYSTEYSINVGIPSKSGVGGGIMGVLPEGAGVGVYGPSLDSYGNSIAGMELLKDISQELNLNIFNRY